MKQKLLMPHSFKLAGWILMIPLIVAWLVVLFYNGGDSCQFLSWVQEFINENAGLWIVLLSASMLMVAFSREKDEDEYVASVRTKYLMLAFYIDFVFLAITAFAVHDLDYLNIMALQMFMILFLHIVMFNIAMVVIRKRRSHEE